MKLNRPGNNNLTSRRYYNENIKLPTVGTITKSNQKMAEAGNIDTLTRIYTFPIICFEKQTLILMYNLHVFCVRVV